MEDIGCVFPKKTDDRRIKRTPEMVEKIKELRSKGYSYRKISEHVPLSDHQIKIIVDPHYAEQWKVWQKFHRKKRYMNFPGYKKQITDNQRKLTYNRYHSEPDFVFYQLCHNRCTQIKKNWGTLQNYRKFVHLMFHAKKDPTLNKKEVKEIRRILFKKMRTR